MVHFERNQKSLLTIHILRTILEVFTSTFLTSHILSVNPDDVLGQGLLNIGLFYMVFYASYIICYALVSNLVRKGNHLLFFRIGILVNLGFLISLVFWGSQIASWIVIAGLIYGISDGFYYSNYLVMKNSYSPRVSMKEYNILSVILINIVKIIIPTILGLLIDVSSLSIVAIYVIVIVVAQFIVTFTFKDSATTTNEFKFIQYVKFLKENPDVLSKVKYTYRNSLIAGVKSTYSVIVVLLTIYTFKTNLSLGIFTSLFSVATILLLMLYKKLDNNPKVNKFIIYMSLGAIPVVGCIVMVAKMTTVTLVIYNFLLTIAIYFSEYFGNIERDAIIKNVGHREFIAEHQFMCELVQCISRIVAYSVIMCVGLFASITAFKILLVCYITINPLKFYNMHKQRLVRKELEQLNENK